MSHAEAKRWIETLRVPSKGGPGLKDRDPAARPPGLARKAAEALTRSAIERMGRQQYLLYADDGSSLLIVLQGLDAAGKDGSIRHVFTGMNPQGVDVTSFKVPTEEEAAHDFLWRAHRAAPRRGQVAIFNRSHYEDVLVTRVHGTIRKSEWEARLARIDAFESLLAANGTAILKIFLHLSPEEQLARFRKRLEDPARQWKISESDYSERAYWKDYAEVYEAVLARTSHDHAPWHVVPADRKWVRDLAIAELIADRLEAMGLTTPPVRVDLADIRRRFHAARKDGL